MSPVNSLRVTRVRSLVCLSYVTETSRPRCPGRKIRQIEFHVQLLIDACIVVITVIYAQIPQFEALEVSLQCVVHIFSIFNSLLSRCCIVICTCFADCIRVVVTKLKIASCTVSSQKLFSITKKTHDNWGRFTNSANAFFIYFILLFFSFLANLNESFLSFSSIVRSLICRI